MGSDHIPILAVAIPLAGVVGLFVGSFLNVVVYRAPLGLSVAAPRSFCTTCQRQLRWWENIPVASWLALRGRCRTCQQAISVRYPLVELSTAVIFALITWALDGSVLAAAYCCLAAGAIAIGLIEYGGQRAPLSIAAAATAAGQMVIVVDGVWQHHWRAVDGSLLGTSLALLLYAVLRAVDPECADPRGHGRSAVLVAGCWVGGLGPGPVAFGALAWVITYFVCMCGAWWTARVRTAAVAGPGPAADVHPILSVPLVTAIGVALMASLVAGA